MLTANENGYLEDDGYFVTQYNSDWEITSITRNTDDDDGKVATPVVDGDDNTTAYTYTHEGVFYTYEVDSLGVVTGYSEQLTEDGETVTYSYDASGNYLGYSKTDGTQIVNYDADGNFVSSSINPAALTAEADGTYSYTDANGTTTLFSDDQGTNIVGYVTNYSWDGGSETTRYDADWNMIETSITEGSKTTTYNSNWEVTGTSTNFDGQNSVADGEYTVYTETDDWGGETTYYVVTATGELSHYVESYSGSYEYTDWTGAQVTSNYSNSYTFDGNGLLQSHSNSNTESDGSTYSSTTTYNYDENGNLTGSEISNEWSDSYGSGTYTSVYDANGNELSSSGTNSYIYYDADGQEQTGTSSYSMTTHYDEAGEITGYTNAHSWDGGSETTEYNANWEMVTTRITEGSITTTYDSNWNIIETTTNFDGQSGVTDGEYTVYTEADQWGGETSYYVLTATGELVKYTESYSGSYTYTDWNGQEVTSEYANTYTYDADGNMISSSGSNTDSSGGSYSYSTTNNYDDQGVLTGYTTSNEWSDNYGSGSSTSEFDANWNELSSSSINTYTYIDENGVEQTGSNSYSSTHHYDVDGNLTGHTTTSTWDGGSETTEYNANWEMVTTTIIEGSKTTTYDSNWNIVETTISFDGLEGVQDGDYTVYTEADDWGGETTYYVLTATGELDKFTESYSGSYSYTDWTGEEVTSSYSNSYTYDADGNLLEESGSNSSSNGGEYSYGTVHHYDVGGNLTGYTSTNSWSDSYGSGTSTTEFDANWNEIGHSSSGTNTYTYFDEEGNEQTGTTSYSQATNYDSDGNLIGYTNSNSWEGGSETIEYDANWNMVSATVTEGSTTTTYDGNWNVVSVDTDFTGLESVIEGDYTLYTEVDNWGDVTTYYTLTTTGELVKTTKSESGSYDFVDYNGNTVTGEYQHSRTTDANGNVLAESHQESKSDGSGYSDETTYHQDDQGVWTIHTSANSWSDSYGSGNYSVEYDTAGNIVSETHSDSYSYTDENGEQQTNTNSHTLTSHYDEAGILTGSTETGNWSNSYGSGENTTELDANGNILSETGTDTHSYLDDQGVEQTSTNTFSNTYQYDEAGVQTSHSYSNSWQDPQGSGSYSGEYDAQGNIVSESHSNSYTYIDASGTTQTREESRTTTANYDGAGILIGYTTVEQWTDGEETGSHTYEYDADWNPINNGDNPDQGSEVRTDLFDANGNVIGYSITDAWSDEFNTHSFTAEFNLDDVLLYETGARSHTYVDASNTEQIRTESYTITANYDGNVVVGYTEVVNWTDAGNSGTDTFEFDANWNPINNDDNPHQGGGEHTDLLDAAGNVIGYTITNNWSNEFGSGSETSSYDLTDKLLSKTITDSYSYTDNEGLQQIGTFNRTETFHYDGNGVLTGSSVTEHNADNGFVRDSVAQFNAAGQLISEVEDEVESYIDEGGATVIVETIHEETNATYDQNGNIDGYNSVETFDEPGFGAGTLTSEYTADFTMVSGQYNYTDANGAQQSGNMLEVELKEYAEDGVTLTGHTEVELRFGSDGNVFEVNKHDANWNNLDELDGTVNAPVTGSVSQATLTEDLNLLLSIEGGGFDTLVTGDVSGAVVNADSGDLAGSSWLAIDADGNDSFDQTDALIEITGTNLVDFNNEAFI